MKTKRLITGKIKYALFVITLICPFISGFMYAQAKNIHNHQMNDSTMMHRQHMIHSHSSMVMPFDMNKVTHYFIKTEDGGNLLLRVKDPKDTLQTGLIRKHLEKEKTLFSKADFRDPQKLHGKNMPGLKKLSKSKGKFKVDYKELTDGAQLTFTSKDSSVVSAIHEWFDAQLKEHGSDAKSHE